MLEPAKNRAGRRPVITAEEDDLIKKRMRWAAASGFAWRYEDLKAVMTRISNDSRERTFPTDSGALSGGAVRAWRTRNRDITYRRAEDKSTAKLFAESHNHMKTFEKALMQVETRNPGLFNDDDRLWNTYETAVYIKFGENEKCFAQRAHITVAIVPRPAESYRNT